MMFLVVFDVRFRCDSMLFRVISWAILHCFLLEFKC